MLASLSERHRITKVGLKFADLTNKEMKQFYKEAVDHVVNCSTANLTAFEATMRVAMLYNIVVADCDRGRIKTIVNSRLVAAKEVKNLLLQSLPMRLLPLTMSWCMLARSVVALHLPAMMLLGRMPPTTTNAASVVQVAATV